MSESIRTAELISPSFHFPLVNRPLTIFSTFFFQLGSNSAMLPSFWPFISVARNAVNVPCLPSSSKPSSGFTVDLNSTGTATSFHPCQPASARHRCNFSVNSRLVGFQMRCRNFNPGPSQSDISPAINSDKVYRKSVVWSCGTIDSVLSSEKRVDFWAAVSLVP